MRDAQHLANFAHREIHLEGQFLGGRLAPQILLQLPLHAHEFIDGFDHVHRNADGPGLIGNGTRNGLTHPPGGVG